VSGDGAWRPRASVELLRQRARLLSEVREFFRAAGVMEFTPPVLRRRSVTAPNIHSISALVPELGGEQRLFLQTSPEYFMKRALAAGVGAIYAITPAFRGGEIGRHHNPEFSLLEWYRPGFSLMELMDEVQSLLEALLGAMPSRRLRYDEAFRTHIGLDPLRASDARLREACAGLGAERPARFARDDMLDLLFSTGVQPKLGAGISFVHGYPASQAALARLEPGPEPCALRFEVFVDGMELGNAYEELCDAAEQSRRFEADRQVRREAGLPDQLADEQLLAALEAGMPPCSGIAVGLDRVLMLRAGVSELRDVLAFPFERL
jgi:lysyl-tRNA synthetase class 2